MSIELSVRENCMGLTAEKSTERKKCGENLKTFLSSDAAPSMLNENTFSKHGFTWDNLFEAVHDYVLKEIEKYETSKSFESTVKPLATTLLHMTVTGSKKGKAYIKCEKITGACMFILRSPRMTKAMGDAYLNLLYKYVISCRYYSTYISPQTWDELLDVCTDAIGSSYAKLDYYTKLRLVLLLIQNGSKCCQFICPSRDILPRLEKHFVIPTSDKRVQEVIIEITFNLAQLIATEYRLVTCQFSESVLGNIISFYDQLNDKKKIVMFDLLHTVIVLHHPQGRSQNEKGSIAFNWDTWNKLLNNILELINLEVKVLQKYSDSRFQSKENVNKYLSKFYDVAAAVFYQVFNRPEQTSEHEFQSASKRQKLSHNKHRSLSDLTEELRQSHVPWLGIVSAYVKKNKLKVAVPEYMALLQTADLYISNNHSNLNWELLGEFTCLVLNNLLSQNPSRINNLNNILLSLWNSSVRYSTLSDVAHKALHLVLQCLLRYDIIDFENVQCLMKLYQEKAMPVTDHSVKTLSQVLHTFYSKFNDTADRIQCFTWFHQTDGINCIDTINIQELLMRLIADENVDIEDTRKTKNKNYSLYDNMFLSLESSILLSEFEIEYDGSQSERKLEFKTVNVINDVTEYVSAELESKLKDFTDKVAKKDIKLIDYLKYLKLALSYYDLTIKNNDADVTHVKVSELFNALKNSLTLCFTLLTAHFKNCGDDPEELELLISVQVILTEKWHPTLCTEIRLCINRDFFYAVNNMIHNSKNKDESEEEHLDSNCFDIKGNCCYVLAAYCKVNVKYREDILNLILDPKLYNFSQLRDFECAFHCISILLDSSLDDSLIEFVFDLMMYMCKNLFRNSQATCGILQLLLPILEKIWMHPLPTMRNNCDIMIKCYLQRCEKLFYPPHVAALIYELVAKTENLRSKEDQYYESNFKKSLIAGTKSDLLTIRVYCSYLFEYITANYSLSDIQSYTTCALELFVINVSNNNETLLKDERRNRTFSVLHGFLALAQSRQPLINSIVKAVMKVQKEKILDKKLVKKVSDKIVKIISYNGIDIYLKNNVLEILHFWCFEHYKISELPVFLLGFEDMNAFLENNTPWVVPAEILWHNDGIIEDSDVLQEIKQITNSTTEDIIEKCFCNIIFMCIPYIVDEKYGLNSGNHQNAVAYNKLKRHASILFQSTRQLLGNLKWSDLFAENMGELVFLSTLHLVDVEDINRIFGLNVPQPTESFYYTKEVHSSILKYFGELITEDIMHHLCEHQPMVISKIVVRLWERVLQKSYLENEAVHLHVFITFTESIVMGFSSDDFVSNFACHGFLHLIKHSKRKEEIKLYIETLRILLHRILPSKSELLRETLPMAVSLLSNKIDEGFESECNGLLDYLVSSVDHTDGLNLSSQRRPKTSTCSTKEHFKETLENYMTSLSCSSSETLCKLKQFLLSNEAYVQSMSNKLKINGFSEDCQTSLLHRIINMLNNIVTSGSDSKTVIEACNCLVRIGAYDLKTLVMASPPDFKDVMTKKPSQHFAIVVLKCLSQVLVDENPLLVSKVMSTLSRLFKYREGKFAFDVAEVKQHLVKQFLPVNCNYINARFEIDERKFDVYLTQNHWLPVENESHLDWLSKLTASLIDIVASRENYLASLGAVCKLKPSLGQSILPPLVGLILCVSNDNQILNISAQINNLLNFFQEKYCPQDSSENSQSTVTKKIVDHNHKMIIQDVLNIVNFVRLQRNHYLKRPRDIESMNYLNLEYDTVAWAASIADNSLAAIYYGELWAMARNHGVPPDSPEATARLPGGDSMQRVFRKCFTSIGEIDAIDGCGSGHLTSEEERRRHLMNVGQYSDALLFHDIALSYENESQDNVSLHYGVVRSLHKSGMYHLALQYIKSLPENDKLADVKYDCLSFLGDWSVFVDNKVIDIKLNRPNANINTVLKEMRYASLKDCLNIQATQEFENKLKVPLDKAKLAVSKLCQTLNMDNCQSVYNVISQLQMFSDIEDYYSVRCNKLEITDLLNKWQVEKLGSFQDFKHVESLVAQRSLILEHTTKYFDTLKNDIINLQLRYAELCLSNDRTQLSQRLLAMAKKSQTSGEVSLLEGQISWVKGHQDISLSLLRNIMGKQQQDVKLTAEVLRQYGTWMAESKCENARDIIDKYLKRSLDILGDTDNMAVKLKIYFDIARFADAEYKQIVSYMKSTIFENKVKCMENMKGLACTLRSTQNTLNRDEKNALMTNERLGILEESEIQNTMAEKKTFLELAMRFYLLSLKQGDDNNLSVFRVISLWFDNTDIELEKSSKYTFEQILHEVPSRKYVLVLPQLAPRLTEEDNVFAHNLRKIVRRCAEDHPHHTLPILFGIKNSDKDKMILNASASMGVSRAASLAGEPRVAAAGAVLRQLAEGELAQVVAQMDTMCNAIISFANFETKLKDLRQNVPRSEPICKLHDLDKIPIPTITLPIRSDCSYTDFPAILSFADTFELVGGINCPKKMKCKGSDGKYRTLLIKGRDDPRQDAVMQQVFSIVNTLLEINPVTSRNKLLIRTYKVVAMSRRSGVLEWCEGTVPLGVYLIDAHRRYRPQDISCSAAREKMTRCHIAGKSNAEKLAVFTKILRDLKPVFHYFFTEHFLDPVAWYERRLAYTKSVATSSMVGYIMGLGDRHVQNILIDKKTAEVVHIDFGIAFDQGKALPTPETVPFRLTQDMVAGFGCSGVEGIFRRSCEKTMQLLRDNHEALLTILEVLLCDPLYSWTVTPAQAKRKQNISTTPRDTTLNTSVSGAPGSSGLAQRALLAVGSKLGGEGAGRVAGAGLVAELLRRAADPANLARLFPGWQPYL